MTIAAQGFASASGQEGFSRTARKALAQVLSSPDFDASWRLRDFLRFVVEEALAGRGEHLTPAAIATWVFGRKGDFDPLLDPIVRIQAGRLRRCPRALLPAGRESGPGSDPPAQGQLPSRLQRGGRAAIGRGDGAGIAGTPPTRSPGQRGCDRMTFLRGEALRVHIRPPWRSGELPAEGRLDGGAGPQSGGTGRAP